MKGMRGANFMALMAAILGSGNMPKQSNKQLSISKGEYQPHKGKGIGSLNQRQRRKLERQNPHLRRKIL